MNEFKLGQIKIGFADGEREANNLDFENLFYTGNKKYEQIMQRHKFIISGRKGTGKTILTKYFQKMNDQGRTIVSYSKLNQISLHEYIDIETPNINQDIRILFQEFYIYKQFVMTILDHKISIIRFFREEKTKFKIIKYIGYLIAYNKLKNVYKERYPDGPYKEEEVKTIQKIIEASSNTTKSNMVVPLEVGINQSSELSKEILHKKKNFAEQNEQIKRLVFKMLRYINVVIMIDDLDEIRIKDIDHLIEFLICLTIKVNEINAQLAEISKESKCILLLRSDIIDMFSNRNSNIQKILSDSNVELQWYKDISGDEISDMIMYKIKMSLPDTTIKSLELKEIRSKLFPNTDASMDSFIYMLNRTFGRPRDFITYINTVIDQSPNSNKFSIQVLKDSEAVYSSKFYNELKNEMSLNLNKNTINEIEKLFRSFGKRNFKYSELKSYYSENIEQYSNISDLDNILQYLYKIGFIGTFRKIKRVGKVYSWSYRNGGEFLNKNNTITIHQGLIKALNV